MDAARLLIHQFVDVSIKGVLHWVYPAVSFMTSVTASFGTVNGRKWWNMLSNVLNDIININNIPSSYIFEHILAICLLTERLILLTVAIPMELFSWLCVGAKSTTLVKYITWLAYSGKYLKYDLNQWITLKNSMLPEAKCCKLCFILSIFFSHICSFQPYMAPTL
jgi:hypothetical protein